MTNFFTVSIIVLLIVGVYTIGNIVGDEVYSNPNLDNESRIIINNINYQLENSFSESDFSESPELNGSFEGLDESREFLESKSAGQQKTGILNRVSSIPDLVLLSLGIKDEWVTEIKWIITILAGLIISVVSYNMFFARRISK